MVILGLIEPVIATLAKLSVLVFVIASMLEMGFSLTAKQIITPLRNYRLVIGALIANFVMVPLAAYLILQIIPLDQGLAIGLALLATCAGAAFLTKLARVSKSDEAMSVGVMVLLMTVTVVYTPIVLPLILGSGVSINPLSIASKLIVLMILPLIIGLIVRARYKGVAESLHPHMNTATSVALVMMFVLIMVLGWEYVISVIGTGAIISLVIFCFACLGIGVLFAGKNKKLRSVFGLATAQRNIEAAIIIASQSFPDDFSVLTMLIIGAIVMGLVLFPLAGELGRRRKKANSDLDS